MYVSHMYHKYAFLSMLLPALWKKYRFLYLHSLVGDDDDDDDDGDDDEDIVASKSFARLVALALQPMLPLFAIVFGGGLIWFPAIHVGLTPSFVLVLVGG